MFYRPLSLLAVFVFVAGTTCAIAYDNPSERSPGRSGTAEDQHRDAQRNSPNQGQQDQGQQNQPYQPQNHQNQANQSNQSNQQAPVGFVLIEERDIVRLGNDAQLHLLRARAALNSNNPSAAAQEVGMATAFLKMQQARSNQPNDNVLNDRIADLRNLHQRLLQGKQGNAGNVSVAEFEQIAAKTSWSLAKYFNDRAQNEFTGSSSLAGAYDLNAAAVNLKQALLWSNTQTPTDQNKAIDDAHAAAMRLIDAEIIGIAQPGEAQPAGGRMNGNQQPQIDSSKQAGQELGRVIDSYSQKFQGHSGTESPMQGNQPGANQRSQ